MRLLRAVLTAPVSAPLLVLGAGLIVTARPLARFKFLHVPVGYLMLCGMVLVALSESVSGLWSGLPYRFTR